MNSPRCLEACSSLRLSGLTLKSAASKVSLVFLRVCSMRGFSWSNLRSLQQPWVFFVPLHLVQGSLCFPAWTYSSPSLHWLHRDGQERRPRNTSELLTLCSQVTHDLSRQACATNSHKHSLTNVGCKKAIFT